MIQTISFLKTFKTSAQAEAYTKMLSGKSIILHLWDSEPGASLFSVCDEMGVNSILDAFREANPQQDDQS
jgi:hypothetical protein